MRDVDKSRTVGDIEIIVVQDGRLFLVDRVNNRRKELTDEYRNRMIDAQLMDELECRFRGTHPFEDESLLTFLKNDRKT